MILQCKVHCWSITEEEADMMGVEDSGQWIKAAYDLTEVCGVKQATSDVTDELYHCTCLYLKSGDIFTVDVTYDTVLDLWSKSRNLPVKSIDPTDISL